MQIGTIKFRFRSPVVTENVSRKPIKYPTLSQWTGFKVTAILQIVVSLICVFWFIMGIRGLQTSIPLYLIAVMALQGFGAPYNLTMHRREIERRKYLYPMREYGS